tara:strand:+ start:66 stop:461 length:396 start_codon:yes stop_codon:yes gene_type:complete
MTKKPLLDYNAVVKQIMLNPLFEHTDSILDGFEGIKRYLQEFRMKGRVLPEHLHWSYVDVKSGIHTGRLQRLTDKAKINTVMGELQAMKVVLTDDESLFIQVMTGDLLHHLTMNKLNGKKYSLELEKQYNK